MPEGRGSSQLAAWSDSCRCPADLNQEVPSALLVAELIDLVPLPCSAMIGRWTSGTYSGQLEGKGSRSGAMPGRRQQDGGSAARAAACANSAAGEITWRCSLLACQIVYHHFHVLELCIVCGRGRRLHLEHLHQKVNFDYSGGGRAQVTCPGLAGADASGGMMVACELKLAVWPMLLANCCTASFVVRSV